MLSMMDHKICNLTHFFRGFFLLMMHRNQCGIVHLSTGGDFGNC